MSSPNSTDQGPQLQRPIQQLIPEAPGGIIPHEFGPMLANWIQLVDATKLPENTSSTDPQVERVFATVEAAIQSGGAFARLAHFRLLAVFESLEGIIQWERKCGFIMETKDRKQKNVILAIDKVVTLLQKADRSGKNLVELRRMVFERKRAAKRWARLACGCPFFLIIYTGEAEGVVKNFSKISETAIQMMASQIRNSIHPGILTACRRLDMEAQLIHGGALCDEQFIERVRPPPSAHASSKNMPVSAFGYPVVSSSVAQPTALYEPRNIRVPNGSFRVVLRISTVTKKKCD